MQKYLFYYLFLFTIFIGAYFIYAFSIVKGNVFVYPLDDVYIHMAIAKNFGESGFWSINPNSFDSASSSILYTLLLSFLIKVFGDNLYYPMLLNIISGYITVYWIYRYFKDFYSEQVLKVGIVVSVLSMLYVMVLLGMEQTLHMMLSVMALYYIKKSENDGYCRSTFLKLLTVILFLAMVRFESMFFVTAFAVMLFINKKVKEGVCILIVGFLPIIIFGLISIQQGGLFFPNSVLIKGNYPSGNILQSIWIIFKKGILTNVSFYKLFLFPFICIGIYLYDKYKGKGFLLVFKNETIIMVVVATALLQSLFGLIKHRYENYVLIMVFIVIVSISGRFWTLQKQYSAKTNNRRRVMFLGSFALFGALGIYLVVYYHFILCVAPKNIQEQQVEMSRFLKEYYKGQKVVANDIGAISYFSGVELLDMVGLGSTDVTRFLVDNKKMEEKELNTKFHIFLAEYTERNEYKVAVIYPDWYPNRPPKNWIPIASWKIKKNLGVARDQVVWYAIDKKEADKLSENIKKFNLNENVIEEIYYK